MCWSKDKIRQLKKLWSFLQGDFKLLAGELVISFTNLINNLKYANAMKKGNRVKHF